MASISMVRYTDPKPNCPLEIPLSPLKAPALPDRFSFSLDETIRRKPKVYNPDDPFGWRTCFLDFERDFRTMHIYIVGAKPESIRSFDYKQFEICLRKVPIALAKYLLSKGFPLERTSPETIWEQSAKLCIHPPFSRALKIAPDLINEIGANQNSRLGDAMKERLVNETFPALEYICNLMEREHNKLPPLPPYIWKRPPGEEKPPLGSPGNPIWFSKDFNWYSPGYYLFTVVVVFENKKHFFIGSTGSYGLQIKQNRAFHNMGKRLHGNRELNHFLEAFLRLTGSDLRTEAAEKEEHEIYAFAWAVLPFDERNPPDLKEDNQNRQKTGLVKQCLIHRMHACFGSDVMLNTLPPNPSDEQKADAFASEILESLKRSVHEMDKLKNRTVD